MKKKMIIIMSAGVLMAASLTGCGTKAEATDNIIVGEENLDSEEKIVVSDAENNETIDNEVIEDEVASNAESTEVEGAIIATDKDVEQSNTTDKDVVFYDKTGYSEYDFTDVDYEDAAKTVTFEQDTSVYSDEGVEIGYIKGGSTINITEHLINSRWYRFENPVNGTDYDYLYVIEDDFPIDESELLTSDEVKEWIIEDLNNYSFVIPVFLDEPDSDMEYVEFSIDRQGNRGDAGLKINQVLFPMESDVISSDYGDYSTYYVECTENDMNVDCRVYYKDFVDPKDFYDKSK